MNKRIRKKKQCGEFSPIFVVVRWIWDVDVGADAHMCWFERLTEFAEKNHFIMFGPYGEEGITFFSKYCHRRNSRMYSRRWHVWKNCTDRDKKFIEDFYHASQTSSPKLIASMLWTESTHFSVSDFDAAGN